MTDVSKPTIGSYTIRLVTDAEVVIKTIVVCR
jgi:hypothetical protein